MAISPKNPNCECRAWLKSDATFVVDPDNLPPPIPCPAFMDQALQDTSFQEGCHSKGVWPLDEKTLPTEYGSETSKWASLQSFSIHFIKENKHN